jgi:hypothetical protein
MHSIQIGGIQVKEKVFTVIKRSLIQLLSISVFLALGLLVALLISHFSGTIVRTVMVYEGFILVLAGALLSPRYGHSIVNVNALDQPSATQLAHLDLEINRVEQQLEREDPSYYKNFFRQIKGSSYILTLIITGAILLLYALNYL